MKLDNATQNVCLHSGPASLMPTQQSPHELSRHESDSETAAEMDRSHPVTNTKLDHLTMTNIIVVGFVRTGRLSNIRL